MLTDYQIGRIQQFTDSVRAGNYIFPQNQLRELAVILDEHLKSIEKNAERTLPHDYDAVAPLLPGGICPNDQQTISFCAVEL